MGHLSHSCRPVLIYGHVYKPSELRTSIRSASRLTKRAAHRDLASVVVLLDQERNLLGKGGSTGVSPPVRRTELPTYLPFIVFWKIAIRMTLANLSSSLMGRIKEDVYPSPGSPIPEPRAKAVTP